MDAEIADGGGGEDGVRPDPNCEIWCCRRLDVHQITSVLALLICKRLDRSQTTTSSIHVDICSWRLDDVDDEQKPQIF
jgi:hypothetical protein